ncbi:MAG: tyrosine-type recombinase/integrase, partial [Chthoniobacterales bacterium]|nr:tyrosine-type recombinase/integrase [Chthoniobacterales bacterium]
MAVSLVDGCRETTLDTIKRYAYCYAAMSSIHRQTGRPNWFCAFTIGGKRVFRSTKTADKKQAREICRAWHKAALLARKGNGKLTVEAAREVIARGVGDVFAATNVESLPSATVRTWCETWLEAKSLEAEASTHSRYARIAGRFIEFLGAKADRDIATLEPLDITRFRDREAKELSRATANLSLKVLRVCFGEAMRQELRTGNPAVKVKVLELRDKSTRRAFTTAEIKRILQACGDDAEWRGLVLFGLYLGQRLGDLAKLTWRAVNLESNEIAFTARKTGRRIVLPLVQPLADYLSGLPAGDDPDAFIFPRAASATRTGTLSNQFRELLVSAGLVAPRSHESTGKGRSQSRETSALSFHSLRHSVVTMLKQAGVSDVL